MKIKLKNILMISFLAVAGIFGVSSALLNKQAEETPVVEKADAATENVTCIYLGVECQLGDWDSVYIKFNSVTHPNNFHYKDSFASFIGDGRDGITKDGSGNYYHTLTRTQDWNGSNRQFEWYVPVYIKSFNYTYGWANHSDVCYGKNENGEWNSVTIGNNQKDYIYWGNNHALYSPTSGGSSKTNSTTYYTVTHNRNSGTGVDASQKVYQYFNAVNPGNPTRSGYTFIKWATSSTAPGTAVNFSDEITTNKTIYAIFGQNRTITYQYIDVEGVTVKDSTSETKGQYLSITLATPVVSGYHFEKWYTDYDPSTHVFSGDSYAGGATYTVGGSNATLYAKFIKNGYYLVGDATFMTSIGKEGQTTWSYLTGLLLDLPINGGDIAVTTVQLNATSQFKVYCLYGDGSTNDWVSFSDPACSDGVSTTAGNYTVSSKKFVDVYVNSGKKSYASAVNHSFTYKYVVDGLLQDKIADGSVSGVTPGKTYDDVTDPTLIGCTFDGWYKESSLTNGISTRYVTYSGTVYAKFTSNSSSTTIFLDVPNTYYGNLTTNSDGVYYTYVKVWNGTSSAYIKLKEMTSLYVSGNRFFRVNIPSDANGFLFDQDGVDGGNNKQTIDFHIGQGDKSAYNNGHNVVIVTAGSNNKRGGEWLDVLFYVQVSSTTAFAEASTTTYNANQPDDPSTGNLCELMNVSFPANSYIRIMYKVFYSDNTVTDYHKIANGEDAVTDSSKWTYIENTSNVGVHNKSGSSKTVNIYVVGSGSEYGRMYFVNASGVTAAGYLYLSSQLTPSQMKITCTVNSVSKFAGARLSTVTAVENVTNLGFNGIKGMTKVPLYNLKKKGLSVGDVFNIEIISTVDSKTATFSFTLASATGNGYIVYLNTSDASWGSVTAYTTNAAAADAGFDIAKAIDNATQKSVCTLDQATALLLKSKYNVSGVSTVLTSNVSNYYVNTWNTTVGDSGANIGFAPIYSVINSIATTGAPSNNAIHFFSPLSLFNEENNVSTIIIIVSSSIALLSITALSILVIKKRKNKEE